MSNHYTYSYRVYPKKGLISREEMNRINQHQFDNNLRTFGRYEYYLNIKENCYDIRFMNDGGDDRDKRFFENVNLDLFYVWQIHHDYDGGGFDIVYEYNGTTHSECALYKFDKIIIKGTIANPEVICKTLFDHWSYEYLSAQKRLKYVPNESLTVNQMGYYTAYNGIRCANTTFESPIEVGLDHFIENSYRSDMVIVLTTYSFKLISLCRTNYNSLISDEISEIQFIYKGRIVQQFLWHANKTTSQIGRNWWDNMNSPRWIEFKTGYENNAKRTS